MNTLTMQRETAKLRQVIKTASRALLEFEIAQSEWEISKGMGKTYKSVDAFMRHISRKLKR
jgi:hypothetical protein